MNRLLTEFSFVLLCVLLSACEHVDLSKYLEGRGNEVGDEVVFSISPYQISDFENIPNLDVRAVKAIDQVCTHIDFAVFDGENKMRLVNQSSDDKGFGTIATKLPEGTFKVVIIAHNCKSKASINSSQEVKFPDNKVSDTFYYCQDITVKGEAKHDIVLKRAVAKFVLKVNDNVPSDITQFQFAYSGGSSTFNPETGYGSVNSRQTEVRPVASEARHAASNYEIYTFPHADGRKLKITISAQDNSKNTMLDRLLEDVPVEINKITTFSGSFFQNAGPNREASFGLTAEVAWDSDGFTGTY